MKAQFLNQKQMTEQKQMTTKSTTGLKNCRSNTLVVIDGPPRTGKSKLLNQLLEEHSNRRILIIKNEISSVANRIDEYDVFVFKTGRTRITKKMSWEYKLLASKCEAVYVITTQGDTDAHLKGYADRILIYANVDGKHHFDSIWCS